MNEGTAKLLAKSTRFLASAEALLAGQHCDAAVSRAYYAMFHAAQALLNERGLRFRRHSGVHGAFAQHFVKTGTLDAKHHRALLDAFDKRVTADYDIEAELSLAEAQAVIAQAREFIDAARALLKL